MSITIPAINDEFTVVVKGKEFTILVTNVGEDEAGEWLDFMLSVGGQIVVENGKVVHIRMEKIAFAEWVQERNLEL